MSSQLYIYSQLYLYSEGSQPNLVRQARLTALDAGACPRLVVKFLASYASRTRRRRWLEFAWTGAGWELDCLGWFPFRLGLDWTRFDSVWFGSCYRLVWVQVCFVRFPFCLDLVLGFVLFGLGSGLVWRLFYCFGIAVRDVSRFFAKSYK